KAEEPSRGIFEEGAAEAQGVATVSEGRINIAEEHFALDLLRKRADESQLPSARFIPKHIEGAAGAHNRVVDEHGRDNIIKFAVRLGDQRRNNDPDIATIVLAGPHRRDRKIVDLRRSLIPRDKQPTRYTACNSQQKPAGGAFHERLAYGCGESAFAAD